MSVESAPLNLQISLNVRGSRSGPLSDGDTVVDGDRIQAAIQTSEAAHLYLAYCDHGGQLTVFPPQGSIRTTAGEITYAPGRAAELVVDSNPGSETLYVILSREEISSADPRLAAAIRASKPAGVATDCGAQLRAALQSAAPARPVQGPASAGASSTGSLPATQHEVPRRGVLMAPKRPAVGGAAAREQAASPKPAPIPRRAAAPLPQPPVVTIERGMFVSANDAAEVTAAADAHGIAILRYGLVHVAAAPKPATAPAPAAAPQQQKP